MEPGDSPETQAGPEGVPQVRPDTKLFDGNIRNALAILITLGFFAVIGFMLLNNIPVQGHDVLLVMLGGLATAFAGVVAYYFGSSSGSAAKTAMGKG
jgi:hypothetical protein